MWHRVLNLQVVCVVVFAERSNLEWHINRRHPSQESYEMIRWVKYEIPVDGDSRIVDFNDRPLFT